MLIRAIITHLFKSPPLKVSSAGFPYRKICQGFPSLGDRSTGDHQHHLNFSDRGKPQYRRSKLSPITHEAILPSLTVYGSSHHRQIRSLNGIKSFAGESPAIDGFLNDINFHLSAFGSFLASQHNILNHYPLG